MGAALDVAIGLVFLYALLALLVTTIQEFAASLLDLRAKKLYHAIEGMLKDGVSSSPLVDKLYTHPLIRNLANEELTLVKGKLPLFGGGLPSYIPSKTFALALLDVLSGDPASQVTGADQGLARAEKLVAQISQPTLKKTFQLLLNDARRLEGNVDKQAAAFSQAIETWFNDRMGRVGGWYKRQAQVISIVLGISVSVACNASTFKVVDRLWTDSNLRALVVASAQKFHDTSHGDLMTSHLPIGWHGYTAEGWDLLLIPLGWVVTGFAVSLGSGFWFDLLSQALNLRGTGARVSPATGKVED